jgi:hypothetical protein
VLGVRFRVLASLNQHPEPNTQNPSLTLAVPTAKVWE